MMSSHSTNPIFFNKHWTSRIPLTHLLLPPHTNKHPTYDYESHPLYVYFFPRVDFCSSNLNKDDLKARSERRR